MLERAIPVARAMDWSKAWAICFVAQMARYVAWWISDPCLQVFKQISLVRMQNHHSVQSFTSLICCNVGIIYVTRLIWFYETGYLKHSLFCVCLFSQNQGLLPLSMLYSLVI